MGGTFDPIHNGHLVTAEVVRHRFDIDRVLFIPAGTPALKQNALVSEPLHRYLMTVLATADNPHFEVSRIEIDREGTTYTIDTIKALRAAVSKKTKLYFITGADAIFNILTWKEPERLLKICSFIAVTRPGYDNTELSKYIEHMKQEYNADIEIMEVPALAISSTDIRRRVAFSEPVKYLLPDTVEGYIRKNGLYTGYYLDTDLTEAVDNMLRERLSEKRYAHTKSVAAEAATLARIFGEDVNKAYLAGLLHDSAKEFPDAKKWELCEQYNIKPDKAMRQVIDLSHGAIAAELAKDEFGIKDKDILNAIRFHTTGRSGMSDLEKIVCLADCTEPLRADFDGLDEIRKKSRRDLDAAMKAYLKHVFEYNKKRGRVLHPDGIKAMREFGGK